MSGSQELTTKLATKFLGSQGRIFSTEEHGIVVEQPRFRHECFVRFLCFMGKQEDNAARTPRLLSGFIAPAVLLLDQTQRYRQYRRCCPLELQGVAW